MLKKLLFPAFGLVLYAAGLPVHAETGSGLARPPSITAKAFRIVGSKAFSEAELLKLVEHAVGRKLSNSELIELAGRITDFYRQHGFARAHATVPQQNFAGGIVRFLIRARPAGELAKPGKAKVTELPPDFDQAFGDPIQALLERAKWWEARNRIDFSLESLDKLFNIAPNHPSGLAMQAQIAIRRNKPEDAHRTLDKLRRLQPDHPALPRLEALLRSIGRDKAELRRARALVKETRYEKAAAIFRRLYPDGPPSDELTLEYWQIVANTPKGWGAARDGLAHLVENNPGHPRYRLALAEHETSRQPPKRQALQAIIDMVKLPDYSKQARQAWRRAITRLADIPSSIPLLRDYLAAEPSDTAVQEKLTLILRERKRQRRLMADPNYRAGLEGLALLDKGELNSVEPLLRRALRSYPKDSNLLGGTGMLYLHQGRHGEAREYFLQAARITGKSNNKWAKLVKVARFWQFMREARDARQARNFALAENRLGAALRVKPNEPNAIAALAAIYSDRGEFAAAVKTYRRALAIDPLQREALEGLIAVYRQQGSEGDMQQAIAQLSPAQRKAIGATLNRMQAAMLKEQSERLLMDGQEEPAIALLEQAVQLDADDPWSRFTLARLYAKRNRPEQGQALFDDLLARHPDDPDALYAEAEYQSSQEKTDLALATLARIPAAQRSAQASRLQARNLERLASAHMQSGRPSETRRLLKEAETHAINDEQAGLAIALAWGRIEAYEDADRVFDALRTTQPSVHWRLRHAEYLAAKGSPDLRAELDALAAMAMPPDETRELFALQTSFALRTANAHLAASEPALAHQALAPLLGKAPDHISALLIEARAFQAEKRWLEAQSTYAHILRLAPDEPDAQSGLIEAQLAASERTALAQLDALASGGTESLSDRLSLVDRYVALDENERARQQLDPLLLQYPNHPRVLNLAGQLAQREGRLDDEIIYLQKSLAAEQDGARTSGTPASFEHIGFDELGAPEKIRRDWKQKKLAALIDRRADWLSSAIEMSSRSGTSGTSQFNSTEIPVEYRTSWHAGDEVFFRADMVRLDAGSVASTNTDFGSRLLCQPHCASEPSAQKASGLGFMAGYHRDDLRADIGVTPLNFAVPNIVGGVRRDGDFGQLSYSLEASRRPLTGSLLSFAGTRDTNTGQVWGGVVATGGRLGLSLDKGEKFGFWSSLGLHSLTGRNVLANDRFQLMAGGQWRIVNEENRLFSVGLTGMYWHHTRNAGEYTFGHGGYYSPQNYRSLSLPVTYGERYPRFSWLVRAAVSASQSQTQSANYYPADPLMQAQAVALTPGNYITPVYAGGSSSGTGYALRGAWEYQLDQSLFIGGLLSVDRSDNYAPNRALLYLRYSQDKPAAQPVFFPPLPVEPSSQF